MNNTGNKLSGGGEVYTCFPFINKPGVLRRMIKQCTVGAPFFGNFLGLRREDQLVSLSCFCLEYEGKQSRKIAASTSEQTGLLNYCIYSSILSY
jgi:hypothetical protein